jgi:hypothetical protein
LRILTPHCREQEECLHEEAAKVSGRLPETYANNPERWPFGHNNTGKEEEYMWDWFVQVLDWIIGGTNDGN